MKRLIAIVTLALAPSAAAAQATTGAYPTRATADKGRRALAIVTAQWLKALRGFAASPLPKRDSSSW